VVLTKGVFEDWRKSQSWLCAQDRLALNFHWLDVSTKQKDLHSENMPQKSGKEAVTACRWGELRDTHLAGR